MNALCAALAALAMVFTAPARAADAGIVFLGDSGSGDHSQIKVAAEIRDFCAGSATCDGAILLGDNFYPDGVSGPDDPQWKSAFLEPYGGSGLRFHPALGNHDVVLSGDAQVGWQAPAEAGVVWDMPARRYTFVTGPITLIALDTTQPDRAQRRWLRQAIRAAETPWVVVYGHHPLWSGGAHGDTEALRSYKRVLKRADLYLSGHDHDAQIIQRAGLVQVVMGTGGAAVRPTGETKGTRYAASHQGFGYLSATDDLLTIAVMSMDSGLAWIGAWSQRSIDDPAVNPAAPLAAPTAVEAPVAPTPSETP